jgi:hypothetical protein
MTPHSVWVFKAERATFPCGVFSTVDLAEAWIAKHELSGVLTAYPLDHGIYDWATENGYFERKMPATPGFVGSFTSQYQKHYHYEEGVNMTAGSTWAASRDTRDPSDEAGHP